MKCLALQIAEALATPLVCESQLDALHDDLQMRIGGFQASIDICENMVMWMGVVMFFDGDIVEFSVAGLNRVDVHFYHPR